MKNRIKRVVPNASMVVAMLALFVALTGSAYASAQLAKNSVTSKSIKNGAVTGAKIKKSTVTAKNLKNGTITGAKVANDTLTGAQINESTLGSVPEAAKVAGIAGADVITKKHLVQFNVASNRGDAPKTLAKFGPWTLTGRCEVNGANSTGAIDITSSVNDTYTYADSDLDAGETGEWFSYDSFAPNQRNFTTSEPEFLDPATGLSALDGDGQPVGIWVGFPGADCRFVGNIFVNTP
jgi:hypothetical protein